MEMGRGGIYGKRAVGDKYLATTGQAVAEYLPRLVAHNLYLSIEATTKDVL